ncbi:hypothetical protein ASD03_19750 [Ensifer sp. Root127]|nr:hypothetical protein ASD03_19750 [Ensifer sp. Root127]
MIGYTQWCGIPDARSWQTIPPSNELPDDVSVAIVAARNDDGKLLIAPAYRGADKNWQLDYGREMVGFTDWCAVPE